MMCRQASLRCGGTHTVTWLDMSKDYKEGDLIALKGGDVRQWRIVRLYDIEITKKDINQGWRVGGI